MNCGHKLWMTDSTNMNHPSAIFDTHCDNLSRFASMSYIHLSWGRLQNSLLSIYTAMGSMAPYTLSLACLWLNLSNPSSASAAGQGGTQRMKSLNGYRCANSYLQVPETLLWNARRLNCTTDSNKQPSNQRCILIRPLCWKLACTLPL